MTLVLFHLDEIRSCVMSFFFSPPSRIAQTAHPFISFHPCTWMRHSPVSLLFAPSFPFSNLRPTISSVSSTRPSSDCHPSTWMKHAPHGISPHLPPHSLTFIQILEICMHPSIHPSLTLIPPHLDGTSSLCVNFPSPSSHILNLHPYLQIDPSICSSYVPPSLSLRRTTLPIVIFLTFLSHPQPSFITNPSIQMFHPMSPSLY
jgi:hypothetical protein